jgi:hypothetical protein
VKVLIIIIASAGSVTKKSKIQEMATATLASAWARYTPCWIDVIVFEITIIAMFAMFAMFAVFAVTLFSARPARHFPSELKIFWSVLCQKIDSIQVNADSVLVFPQGNWYGLSARNLYVRQCFESLLAEFVSLRDEANNSNMISKTVIIGTSGMGKSTFLLYLMLELVREAKKGGNIILIRFSELGVDKESVSYLLSSAGNVSLYDNARMPAVDYDLSDSMDVAKLGHVSKAAMIVTTGIRSEFSRFDKALTHNQFCWDPSFPVWSFEELDKIAPRSMSEVEKNLRFGIFGGNPRHFVGFTPSDRTSKKFAFVEEMMSEYFSEEKEMMEAARWSGILQYLLRKLASAAIQTRNDVAWEAITSLMWHTSDSEDFFWGSRFMEFLASRIMERREATIQQLQQILTQIIGRGEFGNLFEYRGHLLLLNSDRIYRLRGLGQGNHSKALKFRPLVKKRISTLDCINSLDRGEYGIPDASNFPLIDVIIQPNILIQFTVAQKHRAVTHKLSDIRHCLLQKDWSKHMMIFIVEDIASFSKSSGLADIKQYAMSYAQADQQIEGLQVVEI